MRKRGEEEDLQRRKRRRLGIEIGPSGVGNIKARRNVGGDFGAIAGAQRRITASLALHVRRKKRDCRSESTNLPRKFGQRERKGETRVTGDF